MDNKNGYIPFRSEILGVTRHTGIEYTFRMAYRGDVRPGQFFEVSIPKFGEAPISVSGIADGSVDLTIRRVGKVTNEVFEHFVGDSLMLRGPYGNGFDLEKYKGRELVVIAGGTGLSPVRGVVDYFCGHPDECGGLTLIAGFKSPSDILFLEELGRWRQTANVILTVDCGDENTTCNIGLVTEYIPKIAFKNIDSAQAIVVGPPAMMRFSTSGLMGVGMKESNIWISHERKMCCGLGKCGHCKINDKYVCLDGPVFNFAEASGLLD
jgi:anaerobic sulfite reductase subunit B